MILYINELVIMWGIFAFVMTGVYTTFLCKK